jgi:hypothetical protein
MKSFTKCGLSTAFDGKSDSDGTNNNSSNNISSDECDDHNEELSKF